MKSIKRMYKLLLLFFITLPVTAQVSVDSPYSSYGLGELGLLDHATFVGVGGAQTTWVDSTVLNFYNPASYASLSEGMPLFTTGISSRLSNYSEGTNKYFGNVAGVHHFALAFPVSKRFGFAFGVKPYSRRGYKFVSGQAIGEDSVVYAYEGSGGINDVFLGLATNVIKTEKLTLSIGGNFGYLFGETRNVRKSSLYDPPGATGYVNEKITDVNSIHFDVGTYLSYAINTGNKFAVSYVLDPKQSLSSKYQSTLYFSGDIDDPDKYEFMTSNDSSARITTAGKTTFGLQYTRSLPPNKNDRRLSSEWVINSSYSSTNWGDYSNPYDSTALLNTSCISIGIQFTPEVRAFEQREMTKFYERLKYRVGAYQYSLPYSIGSDQVFDRGLTMGIGIPVVLESSLSSINFGFAIGNRGVSAPDMLSESYYSINLGITIAPGNMRKWFRKPKLN